MMTGFVSQTNDCLVESSDTTDPWEDLRRLWEQGSECGDGLSDYKVYKLNVPVIYSERLEVG